jgi:SAM-dependent methyltransferase
MNFLERIYERWVGGRVFGRRVETLCDHLTPLIPPNARVLDVGCGNGLLASQLVQRRPDVQVRGIDVLIQEQCFIPVDKFDGRVIPFEDASFDVVMFVDVLHHTDDAMATLREAVRVARQVILIKDHPKDSLLAGLNLRFMDWVANRRHGIALPYNYWSRQQWDHAFATLGVTVSYWNTKLGLYKPAGLLFGRGLHFIARLDVPERRKSPNPSLAPGAKPTCQVQR